MEQAVNMFTGGMVLDSHPLVQSSDTLSDALNATYITMNGNEVVLQNDMGNRRVDNAYLPAGYEPVGIKEHGGIIYIAAYNPITHRSQIGSFPSPERNMGTEYEDNITEFSLTKFVESDNIIETTNGVNFLKDDIMLIPLTKDTSLHAGDKFTVYSGDVWGWGNNGWLTNFGPEDLNGPKKYENPLKNSYFTLSLGIMNSQNEFSDITSSLERFDSYGNIIKGLDSDEDKFNTGYFIAPSGWKNNVNNGLTNGNATLLENRGKIGANTYAYKLTGPLYLKAQFNHIQTFSYSMNMSKVFQEVNQGEEAKFTINLYVTGTATYNCPDSEELQNPDKYFDSFKLLYKDLGSPYGNYQNVMVGDIISKEPRIYDSTTGLYTSTITKCFKIRDLVAANFTTSETEENRSLYYMIAVPIFHPTNNNILDQNINDQNIYLSNLSEEGTLDIAKIGTNNCELKMWRYKNTVENNQVTSTLLDYKFNCYKDTDTEFKNFSITLINQSSAQDPIVLKDLITIPDEITTGRQEFLIDWTAVEETKRIKFQDLYLARIDYTESTISGSSDPSKKTIVRFILGTKLFNPCYDESNKDYTSDFGIFMGTKNQGFYEGSYNYNENGNDYRLSYSIPYTDESDRRRDKYLNLWNKITIAEDPELLSTLNQTSIEGGKPVSTENFYEYSEKIKTYDIEVRYNKNWKIEDKDLFVKSITVNNPNTTVSISNEDISQDTNYNIVKNGSEFLTPGREQTYNNSATESPTNLTEDSNNNKFSFQIILKDRMEFKYGDKETRLIGKAYIDLDSVTFKNELIKLMDNEQRYMSIQCQVNPQFDGGYTMYANSTYIGGNNDASSMWGTHAHQATIVFQAYINYPSWDFNNYNISDAYETFIKPFFKEIKCPFTFGLTGEPGTNSYNLGNNYYTEFSNLNGQWINGAYYSFVNNFDQAHYFDGTKFTRVWWVDEDGSPCLLNNSIRTTSYNSLGLFYIGASEIEQEIKEHLYNDILKFLGWVKIGGTFHALMVPLENYYYKAYYINPNNYLFSEDTEVNLKVNINYTLDTTSGTNVSYSEQNNSCLKFYIDSTNTPKTLTKQKTYTYHLGEYAQSLFNFAQSYDLSSYSIDLESGNIISDKDPLKRLYIRGSNGIIKEAPTFYPIQINQGTKNKFPIVCKKKYSTTQEDISNNVLIVPIENWGDRLSFYPDLYQARKARAQLELRASTKDIPILFEEDLVIDNDNFFNT